MSLLMDALKKAELAKRQGSGDAAADQVSGEEPAAAEPLAFPDLPSADEIDTPEPPSLPPLPSRLEALAEPPPRPLETKPQVPPRSPPSSPLEFAPLDPPTAPRAREEPVLREAPGEPVARPVPAEPMPATRSEAPQVETRAKDDARNLFAAKGADAQPRRKNLFAIGVGVTTLLATLAIGGYFWMQLQPKSGLTQLAGGPRPAATPPAGSPSAPAPPVAATTTVPQPAAASAGTGQSVPVAGPAGALPGVATADPANASAPSAGLQTAVEAVRRLTQAAAEPAKPAARRQAEAGADAEPRLFLPTKVPLRVQPGIARGYEAFERGDLALARQEYERVLKSEPQNVDALLGVAAIALKLNRPDEADHYYQKVLVSDPQEPTAISALATLRGRINPAAAEQRLKTLAAASPDLAAPQLALGSLYAGQERWSEAQQAYFAAYSLEPSNADVLFNLAVSLEHLRQPRLAAQYYGLAIEAAGRRPGNFDPAQAQARLRALQP